MGLVVAVLLLAGCTGQEEPAPEPSNGPDGQVTTPAGDGQGPSGPSTEPQGEPQEPQEDYPAPERPEAMENNDIDGAEAAATYFLDLFPYIHATGDIEPWNAMAAEECGFCSGVGSDVAALYAEGGRAEAAPLEFSTVSAGIQADVTGDYWVEVAFVSPSIREFDQDGELKNESPVEDVKAWLILEHATSDWRVIGVEVEASDA